MIRSIFAGIVLAAAAVSLTACERKTNEPAPANGPTTGAPTPAPVVPAPGESTGAAPGTMLAQSDVTFMHTAALSGMTEVEAGRMALERAKDPKIKAFAQQMVDDHTAANEELRALAASKNVTLPADIDPEHRSKLQTLQAASGQAFDRIYAKQMVDDHKSAVALFEQEAQAGQNAELKAVAERLLPKLRGHLEQAQQLPGTK